MLDNPWHAVNNFYEDIYPNAGGKVWKFASLQVISPWAPKYNRGGTEERTVFSIMLLGNSGSGKSSIMESAKRVSPRDYYVSTITAAQIEQDMANKGAEGINVVVNDLKRVLQDKDLIKSVEALIGDGTVSRKKMNSRNTEGDDLSVGMIGGAVPSDVTNQIGSGLIFRVVPIKLKYDAQEETEVGESIIMDAGEESNSKISEGQIAEFYDLLYNIIEGNVDDVKRPVGYNISKSQKNIILNQWNRLRTEKGWKDEDVNWFRELQDGIRFACLSALLNINSRKLINISTDKCKINVSDADAKRAKALMTYEMGYKYRYIQRNLMSEIEKLSDTGEGKTGNDALDSI